LPQAAQMTTPSIESPLADAAGAHSLRKALGLRDLVPMQILIVLGVTWSGTAARQGGTHVVFWLLMFTVPLIAGTRFSPRPDLRPGIVLRIACISGITVTLLSMIFSLIPIVDVPHPWLFALRIALTALGINLIGAGIYWRGTRLKTGTEGLRSSPQ
jgi:hypothetical protein